ncbi:MAG: hypothetical protein JSV19_08100 [Phycisphaerales bacterium]|nr:MAG: hypothetical protein JSV19_08100 [Phycisphaerales bacterium]
MKSKTTLGFALGLVLTGSSVFAQVTEPSAGSLAVWNNARGGAIAARRPGLMVQRGMQRYSNRQNDIISRALFGPVITDTAADREVKPITQAKAEAIRIIFENLTALIVAIDLQNQLNAGRPSPDSGGGTSPPTDVSDLIGGPVIGPGG